MTTGDGEHVLRFRRFAEFIVGDEGRPIRWRAPLATRPETVRHLLLDQVLPAVAFEHSLIGLHASAVVINGQGVAFAGTASRGKSSLAASFALDGHPVLTDDSLMLDWPRRVRARCRVIRRSGYGETQPPASWRDAVGARGAIHLEASDRRACPGDLHSGGTPCPWGKIYVIDRRAGPARIEPLSSREAYVELLKTTFHLDPPDRVTARREVAALAAIVRGVPVARLRVPLRLDSLGQVRRAIAADLAGDGSRLS